MSQTHWDEAYRRRRPEELSWYQSRPSLSLELIVATGVGHDAGILDVGGGASMLVDRLLEAGYRRLGVLDVSSVALELARERLGAAASSVEWLHGDVLSYEAGGPWAVWHDRAVLHFLVSPADRERYRECLLRSLAPGGHAIIATFGPEGPRSCSGLETLRFGAEELAAELGDELLLVESRDEPHETPRGTVQPFMYARFERR